MIIGWRYGLAVAALVCTMRGADALEVGMSVEALVEELGQPSGKVDLGNGELLFFQGGSVEVRRGKVHKIEDGFQRRADRREREAAFAAAQRAKGLVAFRGSWMKPEERDEVLAREAEQEKLRRAAQARKPGITVVTEGRGAPRPSYGRVISNGGREVDIRSILSPDQTTILDFYADWCVPCRRLSPRLEAFAREHGAELVKIDIVSWDSPVAKQHGIRSIPRVEVYNRYGDRVGTPTSDPKQIASYVRRAKSLVQ